jgi:predicted amidohydrolase YtcJ
MNKALFACLLALHSGPAAADTLIMKVNGIQVDAAGKLQRFTGVQIGDDGRVSRLYTADDDRFIVTARTKVVDGGGRTMLPGLIDAHGHVMGLGLGALRLDLVGTRSLDELKQRLADYAAANPGNGWIVGRGWNQELWPGQRMPTAADLDSVVPGRPVALERVDGHALVVNSAALRAGAIVAATQDPAGGKIERDAQGQATGLLIDAAMPLVEAKIPAPSAAERDRALAEAQRLLLASGITAVADMGTSMPDWEAMRRAGEAQKLQLRIISYAAGLEPLKTIKRPTPWLYSDRLRMGGVKIYGDGALGSRGAWLKQPYADMPNTSGLQFLDDKALTAQVTAAAAAGFQPAVHAIGDAANAQAIRIVEQAGRRFGKDRRWRIEHAQVVDPADIPRLAQGGIIASMQPIHQVSDREMAEKRLGQARLAGAYAWQTIARSGARLAFGSDFPVEPTNPFLGLSAAVSRQDPNGVPAGGWRPQERASFAQALSGFTRDAAYASFAEDRIGSLEPGKWADFILVDRDVGSVDAQSLAAAKVLQTWVAGRLRFDAEAIPASGRGERGK